MDPLFQFLSSAGVGAIFYLMFVAYRYWKSLGWLFGRWDPNLGFETEEELISAANRNALVTGVLLVAWAIAGPTSYRPSWGVEVMGMALGMLIAYVLLVSTASSRASTKRR